AQGNVHAALTVTFSKFDKFVLGAYTSPTHIRLERSGHNAMSDVDVTSLPAWVQITKKGTVYSFQYKQSGDTTWQDMPDVPDPSLVDIVTPPQTVGLIQKTWGVVPSTGTWDDFVLTTTGGAASGTIAGKVTATGGSPNHVHVQVLDASSKLLALG